MLFDSQTKEQMRKIKYFSNRVGKTFRTCQEVIYLMGKPRYIVENPWKYTYTGIFDNRFVLPPDALYVEAKKCLKNLDKGIIIFTEFYPSIHELLKIYAEEEIKKRRLKEKIINP